MRLGVGAVWHGACMDQALVDDAVRALRLPGSQFAELEAVVPRAPGLYALHAEPGSLKHVEWDVPSDGRPLYIGKAERSLHSRDVTTHFGTGKTGGSTVRRSLASLLSEQLDLHPRPRSSSGRLYPASFALEPNGDARLTEWMKLNLRLSAWASPDGASLGEVETAVLRRVEPPLNLDKMPRPSAMLSARRRALADRVRREFGAERRG